MKHLKPLMRNLPKVLLWALLALPLASCGPDFPHQTATTDGDAWFYKQPTLLTLDFAQADTKGELLLLLEVTEDYPFRNIWVEAVLQQGNRPPLKVMNEFLLQDEKGVWAAERSLMGAYSFQAVLADSFAVPSIGTWQVQLRQMMRSDTLRGVTKVGIGFRPYGQKE
jgi:gliding motility-associated lipoprotein GldH